ncbi:MAG: thioredoxin, partial [Actinobacteria bacterium]|nr:thioredoxin [Actinomycetota bacterium]
FAQANWGRERVLQEINDRLQLPGAEIVRGAGGMAEGVQEAFKDATLPKFRSGGLLLVHAGGDAGLFSAIIGGWANGSLGSDPVTKLVTA